MTASEMITKYSITLVDGDMLRINSKPTADDITSIKAAKPEILAELHARKEAEVAANLLAAKKLAENVPGLEILRNARAEWEIYRDRYESYIASGNCKGGPAKPTSDIEAIKAQYPAAAAYTKAEGYEMAANYRKSAAGRKAKKAIANGMDYTAAIEQMEAEWKAAAQESMWD